MFYVVLYITKFIRFSLRLLGRNASQFPGKVALTLYPDFLKKIDKPKVVIGVTGTNGKTTVCNLLINFFEKNNKKVLNNKFGSNVNSGIASALIGGTSIFNKSKFDFSVLEIDERSTPKILPYVKLDYLVCTNLFRDSIKRNAHSEFIFDLINKNIHKKTKLILNADDIISSRLGEKNKKVFFGIDKLKTDLKKSVNIINDARVCPVCYNTLDYEYVKYHHIGQVKCTNCGFKSFDKDYSVTKIDFDKNVLYAKINSAKARYHLISHSIYNIYNEICVIALLNELKVSNDLINKFFETCIITETRYKCDTVKDIKIISHLAKGQNPIACSCVFDYVKHEPNKKELILLIYDYFDNKESSENMTWIYDCDFEFLNDDNIDKIIIYGPRKKDFKLRLLLAGVEPKKLFVVKNADEAAKTLSISKNKDIYILFDLFTEREAGHLREKIIKRIEEEK